MIRLSIDVGEDAAELVEAWLWAAGCGGLEVQDRDVASLPAAAPLPEGRAYVSAYFADRPSAERARDSVFMRLGRGADALRAQIEEAPEEDWVAKVCDQIQAFPVGRRLWIHPSWSTVVCPPDRRAIEIDPGMAFGTGTHATTALCLEEIEAALARRPGLSVLDVGTGSGILAIAARKLGAARVSGVDDDPVAVRVAQENAAINGADIALEVGSADCGGAFDLVVANILENPLVEMAADLAERVAPGGGLLLAGLLESGADRVEGAYVARGLVPHARRSREGWALLRLGRPEAQP